MVATLKKIIPQWNEKRLKNWVEKDLSELNQFLISTQKRLKTEKNTEIEILIKFLKEIAKFQDKNLEKIKNLKKSLKKDYNKSKALEEFEDVIIVCGRDFFKKEKHKSTVSNLNEKKFNSKRFYLENEFYETPQPLSSLRHLKDVPGIIAKKKQMSAEETAKKFLLENVTNMMSAIADIR